LQLQVTPVILKKPRTMQIVSLPLRGAAGTRLARCRRCCRYRALKERADPVGVLRRKLRTDAGQQVAISDVVTGQRRRRRWTRNEKARIIAESRETGAISSRPSRMDRSFGLLAGFARACRG
jgi:hypothetical protein